MSISGYVKEGIIWILRIVGFAVYGIFVALPSLIDVLFFHLTMGFMRLERKNCLFIVNPSAGKQLGERVLEVLERMGKKDQAVNLIVEPFLPKIKEMLIKAGDKSIYVVVCGGDGTMNSIIGQVEEEFAPELRKRVIYVPMPIGIGNDLSRTLGLGKEMSIESLYEYFEKINSPKTYTKNLDWWTIEIRHGKKMQEVIRKNFLLYVGVGIDADVMCETEAFRRKYSFLFHIMIINKLMFGLIFFYLGFKDMFRGYPRQKLKNAKIYNKSISKDVSNVGSVIFINCNNRTGGRRNEWDHKLPPTLKPQKMDGKLTRWTHRNLGAQQLGQTCSRDHQSKSS